MKRKNIVTLLVILITLISAVAASLGVFSDFGDGQYEYETIRGNTVEIYGTGIYQHMSADVAIQGIAQDYVTLFIAIPLLLIALIGYRKKSVRAKFFLAGIVGYLLVTYLFYSTMAMYNSMFLAYISLMGLSFFAFFLLMKDLSKYSLSKLFTEKTPNKFVGWFLIINAILIAVLWLGVIIPPLLNGTIYPVELNHYTTLIVQGFDLGLLLPLSVVSGFFLIKGTAEGYLYGTVYIVFLAILMTALSAKIIAMSMQGVNVIPAIFIIPGINLIAIISSVLMIRSVKEEQLNL